MQGFVECVSDCFAALFERDEEEIIEIMTGYGYQYVSTHSESSPGDFGFTRLLFTSEEECDVAVTISGHYGTVSAITFTNCNLRLGDLLLLIGEPSSVSIYGDRIFFFPYTFVMLQTADWFTWTTPVEIIQVTDSGPGGDVFRWEGVLPRSYYCHSQPERAYDTC
jgi:hypothetical protein